MKRDSRSRVLLGLSKLDPRINAELGKAYLAAESSILALIQVDSLLTLDRDSLELVAELKQANRDLFQELRNKIPEYYSTQDSLLLFKNRLCIVRKTPLCTSLIREVYTQKSTAYPSAKKTYQLLARQYYWPGITPDIK